jgi:hypothetical protein
VSAFDIGLIACAALTGWFLVSWLFNLAKPKTSAPTRTLSDMARQWHVVLDVPEDATMGSIEARFHEAVADCDRIRFSGLSSSSEVAAAQSRRQVVTAAYEFIRSARLSRAR